MTVYTIFSKLRTLLKELYREITILTKRFKDVSQGQGAVASCMVSALFPGSSSPSSTLSRGHCVVFLGKTLTSHSAYVHLGV